MIDLTSLADITAHASALAELISANKWDLGQLAWLVYTEHGVAYRQFAKDINAGYKSVNEYANVYSYYRTFDGMPLETMERIADLRECEALRYTHFRDAKKLGDLQASLDFLEDAAANLRSIDQCRAILGDDIPQVMSIRTDLDHKLGWNAGKVAAHVINSIQSLEREGKKWRVKVYEVADNE